MKPLEMTIAHRYGHAERPPCAAGILAGATSAPEHQSASRAGNCASGEYVAGDVALLKNVAVLFADIAGFTGLSEGVSPVATLDLLRRYHARMAEAVIGHGGVVRQYSGDSILATFDAPSGEPRAATCSLACAYDMLATLACWNAKRRLRGRFPVNIGIGIHIGEVAMGEIGIGRHVEQSIAGDVVNVACKLERMTRKARQQLIVSHELFDAIEQDGGGVDLLSVLTACGDSKVPGRLNRVRIWGLHHGATPPAHATGRDRPLPGI